MKVHFIARQLLAAAFIASGRAMKAKVVFS
jgi:hypothetical protein